MRVLLVLVLVLLLHGALVAEGGTPLPGEAFTMWVIVADVYPYGQFLCTFGTGVVMCSTHLQDFFTISPKMWKVQQMRINHSPS